MVMLFELLLRSWSIILIAILKQGTRASGNFLITYIISLQCEDIDAKQDCIFQDHFKAVPAIKAGPAIMTLL